MEKQKVIVIFKKFKDDQVIALFPKIIECEKTGLIMSYMHLGQHGAASPDLFTDLKAATPDEYASLKEELEGLGYSLVVRKRRSFKG